MREFIDDCDKTFCREVCTVWRHDRCARMPESFTFIEAGYCLWEVDAKLAAIHSERHHLKAGLMEYARKMERMI